MEPLVCLAKAGIYAAMGISILAAIGTILARNLFHAALCFVVVLLGIAGVFLAVGAEFLAVVQILVYVGAVMTLVIFAIMMTTELEGQSIDQHNKLGLPTLIGAIAFFVILLDVILKTPWITKAETVASKVSVADLGMAIMGPYVFPFEVVGVLLTAALIGAIVVTRKDKSS